MIVLASASPRRQQLLKQIGLEFSIAPQDVDESVLPGEDATNYVQRIADAKAEAALQAGLTGRQLVLAADTAVVCDNRILGKPEAEEDGVQMLLSLSDREHRVLTAVSVSNGKDQASRLCESRVRFRAISLDEARAYWKTSEPEGKAGAYAIQGRAAIFVSEISGSYSGVVGLPLFETACLLEQFGISCLPLNNSGSDS